MEKRKSIEHTGLLVLSLLSREDMYGYQMIVELERRSDKTFSMKEGTLYPILYRLEDDGLIAAKWSQGHGRTAPKKMYEATETGREENRRRQLLWREFQQTVNTFLTGGNTDE